MSETQASQTQQEEQRSSRWYAVEVAIVLGLSLGTSAVYSVVSLVAKLTRGPIGNATANLNTSKSSRPYLDLTYQLLSIASDLVPVACAVFLLATTAPGALRRIGLWGGSPVRLAWHSAALAAAIGLPGLALYAAGRALGITARVIPAGLDDHWWTIPVLVLSALKNGLLEEVIVVAYLADRLPRIGVGPWSALGFSAVLRGAYHLYQGFGAFIGNVVMGVVFWWYYRKTGRVAPLVVAHTLLDVVAFVGYSLLKDVLPIP